MTQGSDQECPQRLTLVTGGSGFVASHLILQLLTNGHTVRTTIRTPTHEQRVRGILQHAGLDADAQDRLSFFVADLMEDGNWAKAMQGCNCIHHVASPFPSSVVKEEDEIIRPAREGTIRILKFARDSGVTRVVLTSSFAAIGYGYERLPVFTEDNWSILDGKIAVPAYHKSKTLAEKAAWDFMERGGGDLELTVINPTGIFGPVLSSHFSSSIQIIQAMMSGNMPGCPQLSFGMVDVRDLADLHIRAMLTKEANGQRFIGTCDNGPVALIAIANTIRKNRPHIAQKLPTRTLPNFVVRTVALFRPSLRTMLPELGVVKQIKNDKAKIMLGWKPRSIEECILDTVDSLIEHEVF